MNANKSSSHEIRKLFWMFITVSPFSPILVYVGLQNYKMLLEFSLAWNAFPFFYSCPLPRLIFTEMNARIISEFSSLLKFRISLKRVRTHQGTLLVQITSLYMLIRISMFSRNLDYRSLTFFPFFFIYKKKYCIP